MAWLSGKRAQHGVGTPAAEDSAQRIATVAAGFRKMFSIVNGKGNKTTKTQRAQRNHNIFVSLWLNFHNTYIEPALGFQHPFQGAIDRFLTPIRGLHSMLAHLAH